MDGGEELARAATLIEAARQGRGGALVVHGDAGIGKSALLSGAREVANDAVLLSVAAVEPESNLPYAGLATLLAPLTGGLSQLPGLQAGALAGALALGPAVPGDRLAVCVATHRILAMAASTDVVLVLVDDGQWLDGPTRECISYAARRLDGTRIAMLIALRDDRGWPEVANLPHLRLAALRDDEATALLAGSFELPASVQEGVLAAAAGNPLALIELPGMLEPDERTGRVPLPEPLRPGAALGWMFGPRVARLPPEARLALLVAAATGTDDLATIWAACRILGV